MPSHGMPVAAVELEDPAGDVVEEVAIVGHRDDRARDTPSGSARARPPISASRWLVGSSSSSMSGFCEQQPAERDAALLAARELRDVGVARRQRSASIAISSCAVEIPARWRRRSGPAARACSSRSFSISSSAMGSPSFVADLLEARRAARASRPRPPRRCRARPWSGRAAAPAAGSRRACPSAGHASPRKSLSTPAMMRSSVRLAGAVGAEHADLGARVERQADAAQDLPLGRDDLAQVLHRECVFASHRARYCTMTRRERHRHLESTRSPRPHRP